MNTFQTHTRETISGDRLQMALNKAANDWEKLGHDIYKENAYADHVTEDIKLKELQKHIDTAKAIRNGEVRTFTIWQRVNTELTGECVALLP